MARAEAASASARSDSIKGLAQSIAKPAYRRLLTAEPALRRAVPALIIAFLLTIGVGAVVQVLDHHRQAIAEATHDIDNVADIVSERFDRLASARKGRHHAARSARTRACRPAPRRSAAASCSAMPTASSPRPRPLGGPIGSRLIDVLGDDAAADHPWRQRRRARNHAGRRQPRLRDGAHAGRHPRPVAASSNCAATRSRPGAPTPR